MKNKLIATILFSALILCTLALSAVTLALTAPDWSVTLTAATGIYTNNLTVFGSSPLATPNWNIAYDTTALPNPPTGINSWFLFPSNPAADTLLYTSIMPTSSGATWDYQLQTSGGVSGTTTISWSTTSVVPSGFTVYLMDTTGTTILANMRTTTQYQFTAAAGQLYDFKVVIAPASQLPEYPIGALAAISAGIAALLVYKRKSLPHLNVHF
jgi:hypothetical protein